jgi:GntR family transcriptional regulator
MNESPELVLDGGAPVCQQIEGQIRRLVQDGILHPGEELPTVRAVAVGLVVNPHAVEQAYDRLARAGWVTREDSSGPRVAGGPGASGEPGASATGGSGRATGGRPDTDLKLLCANFLRQAAGRGHSLAAVFDALHACLEEESSS